MEKTVVFDFDGTLVDSWPILFEILNEVAENNGFKRLPEKEISLFRNSDTRELLKAYKIPLYKALKMKKEGSKIFSRRANEIKLVEGMKETLKSLKASGYNIGILTFSSEEVVKKVLNNFETLDMFDFIYCVAGIKSKSSTFKKMVREQRIDKENLFYVGDELRDIFLAREFGVKVISVSWGYNNKAALVENNANNVVDNVADLLTALTSY